MSGLENLKDLSPKLFNDRIKSMNNTNLSGMNSEFGNLGFVDFFNNNNRPGFIGFYREGSISKYVPNSSKFDNIVSFSKSDVTHLDTLFDDGVGSKYNVSFKQQNSPVTNDDNIPNLEESNLGNKYFEFGNINAEFNKKLEVNQNPDSIFNTTFDDGVGGLFNEVTKYSTAFRNINTPKGYETSLAGNDIISMGNIAPLDGHPGIGYQDRKDLAGLYQNSKTTGVPARYLSEGIKDTDIDMSGFWPVSGQPSLQIPFLNRFVEGSFGEADGKRKVDLNVDVTGTTIFSQDQFSTLYNNNQTVTDNKVVHIGGKEKLNLQTATYNAGWRVDGLGSGRGEPYIILDRDRSSFMGTIDTIGRELPTSWMLRDVKRITKFLSSGAGITFILKQNLLGRFARSPISQKDQKTLEFMGKDSKIPMFTFLGRPQKFRPSYNPLSTLATIAGRGLIGDGGSGFWGGERDYPFALSWNAFSGQYDNYEEYLNDASLKHLDDKFLERGQISARAANLEEKVKASSNMQKAMDATIERSPELSFGEGTDTVAFKPFGDLFSVQPVTEAKTGRINLKDVNKTLSDEMEGKSSTGMPFYFYDMRTNQFIILRGYIEALTENVSPEWNSEKYVGRSEPVYTYTGAERDISFSLKLFAQTRYELMAMYQKLNHLTSLCYPQYKDDSANFSTAKTRMKPPLIKMRMGELYGRSKFREGHKLNPTKAKSATNWMPPRYLSTDMTGFIKSLSYTVPDESPWEIRAGKRVPKYITAAIGYQVIHNDTPDNETAFYGFTGYSEEAMDTDGEGFARQKSLSGGADFKKVIGDIAGTL